MGKARRATVYEHIDLISDALNGNPRAQAIWDAIPWGEKAMLSRGDSLALVEAVIAQAWGLAPAPKGWRLPAKAQLSLRLTF